MTHGLNSKFFIELAQVFCKKMRGSIVLNNEVPEFEGFKKKSMMKCKQMNQDTLMNGSSQKKMLLEGNSLEQKKICFLKTFLNNK